MDNNGIIAPIATYREITASDLISHHRSGSNRAPPAGAQRFRPVPLNLNMAGLRYHSWPYGLPKKIEKLNNKQV